jgi:hypothetical protein
MANIKEVSDGGPNPNTPTIEDMRESQRKGSEGQGTSEYSYAEKMAIRNHGTGTGEGSDPQFPEAGAYAAEGKSPWE